MTQSSPSVPVRAGVPVTTPSSPSDPLVQAGREALREAGAGMNSTYEEDAAAVLAKVLPLHRLNVLSQVAHLLRERSALAADSEYGNQQNATVTYLGCRDAAEYVDGLVREQLKAVRRG